MSVAAGLWVEEGGAKSLPLLEDVDVLGTDTITVGVAEPVMILNDSDATKGSFVSYSTRARENEGICRNEVNKLASNEEGAVAAFSGRWQNNHCLFTWKVNDLMVILICQ